MKKISVILFWLCSGRLALSMDAMSCDWEVHKDVPDYNMIIDQPAPSVSYPLPVADTVIKLEPLEEPHLFVPVLPLMPPDQAVQASSSHDMQMTINPEESISEYTPSTNPRKKRNRHAAWNNGSSSALTPSRIPGKFKCPKSGCYAVLRYKWGLTSHIKRIHGNITRWGCPFFNASDKQCHTTFIANSDYNRHLKQQHKINPDVTNLKKRKLLKSDLETLSNNRSSAFRATVTSLANRPHTRSVARALQSQAQ